MPGQLAPLARTRWTGHTASRPLRLDGWLIAVFILGLVARALVLPLTHGQDFTVWDLAARDTLDGTNVYAHHPNYPGGPFAYFPLFLYLELPFRWLALHGLGSFVVWGKLPIVAADTWCAVQIVQELRERGCRSTVVAAGAAAFFLNPLVIYNSAWYGRFDTLGCALLLCAIRSLARHGAAGRAWPWWFALAVAAKTFPGFTILAFFRAAPGTRLRLVGVTAAVTLGLSLPYLTTPRAFVHDLLVHDLVKSPQGLSWLYLLDAPLGRSGAALVSYAMLAVFIALAVLLARLDDPWVSTAATLIAFLITSKLVLEQYLIWPLALLIFIGACTRSTVGRSAWTLAGLYTVYGIVDNESWHPFGRASFVSVLVGASSLAFLGCVAGRHIILASQQRKTAFEARACAPTSA